ncbi:MAG: response regulator [Nitrospinae bacterium]|nr:response regulator [Nitrospinota bacterium]
MRILIVDDELLGRMVLNKILSAHGHCDSAVNGREAVEAFRMAWEEGDRFNLICMDIMMPEMDGHQALKLIRGYEEERGIFGAQRVKVLMISARDDSRTVLDSFKEGCEGYIIKPIEKDNIEKQLRELCLIG